MAQRVTLDDDMMRARLRSYQSVPNYVRRPVQHSRVVMQDVRGVMAQQRATPADVSRPKPIIPQPQSQPVVTPVQPPPAIATVPPQPTPLSTRSLAPAPPLSQTVPPAVLTRSFAVPAKPASRWQQLIRSVSSIPSNYLRRLQLNQATMLSGLALLLFIVGVGVSLSGFRTNAAAQVAIAKAAHAGSTTTTTTGGNDGVAPSTARVTLSDLKNYHVAADEARYITIPKLAVFARVLVAGTTKSGAMATPSNVFDTARYNGSAKPGQPGATVIDGHVSSWTTDGVFHDIKKLTAGDTIELQRGDGKKLNYTVVQTVTYDANKVDMKSLLQPVGSAASGLNLITCGGKYDSKSGEFTQRVAVFAVLE